MGTFPVFELARQTRTIVKKNLRFLLIRGWKLTLLQAAVIPTIIIALTLNIQNFAPSTIITPGPPSPIKSLRNSLPASKFLVFTTRPGLGPDVDDVIRIVTAPLEGGNVIRHSDPDNLPSQCRPSFHDVSDCYAVVEFNDSPKSKVYNGTWNYTIRVDQAHSSGSQDIENIHLPVQLAIDNAITNSTKIPNISWFMSEPLDVQEMNRRVEQSMSVGGTYAIVYFLAVLGPIYHVASTVTTERGSGMSLLIDAMGGSPAGRVLASMLTFAIIYLPFWIISGVCKYPTHDSAVI
jgi:hypothetical protein